MDGVIAPLLHNNVPVVPVAVKTEFPQLFVTVIPGVGGVGFTVSIATADVIDPPSFVQAARYRLLLSAEVAAKDKVAFVAPVILVHAVPLVLTCHCTVGAGEPVAPEVKLVFAPAHRVCDEGCTVMAGLT